jgi:hypothetical protein
MDVVSEGSNLLYLTENYMQQFRPQNTTAAFVIKARLAAMNFNSGIFQ